jgi:hypothetical protein
MNYKQKTTIGLMLAVVIAIAAQPAITTAPKQQQSQRPANQILWAAICVQPGQ